MGDLQIYLNDLVSVIYSIFEFIAISREDSEEWWNVGCKCRVLNLNSSVMIKSIFFLIFLYKLVERVYDMADVVLFYAEGWVYVSIDLLIFFSLTFKILFYYDEFISVIGLGKTIFGNIFINCNSQQNSISKILLCNLFAIYA